MAENSDTDGFTDSLEECIDDALVGFCVDVDRDDGPNGLTCITSGQRRIELARQSEKGPLVPFDYTQSL